MTPSDIKEDTPLVAPTQWVDEHGDDLYYYAVPRVGSSDDTEDLVQETFLSALEAVSDFLGDASVRTWLFSILKCKLIDYYRKKGRRVDREINGESDESADCYAEGAMKGRWKPETAPRDWRQDPKPRSKQKDVCMHYSSASTSYPLAWLRRSPCGSWKRWTPIRSGRNWTLHLLT